MQAYAEGFDILQERQATEDLPEDERFDLNLPDIAEVWRRGSVISSWLLDLTARRWPATPSSTTSTASSTIPAKAAGPSRRRSRRPCRPTCCRPRSSPASARAQNHTFGEKLLSAMRFGFGGHVEPKAGNHADVKASEGPRRPLACCLGDLRRGRRPHQAPADPALYNLPRSRAAARRLRADRRRAQRVVQRRRSATISPRACRNSPPRKVDDAGVQEAARAASPTAGRFRRSATYQKLGR